MEIENDTPTHTTEEEDDKIISYYEANRTSILKQKKGYYLKKKDILLDKIICECGREITKASVTRHKKTKVHKSYLDNLEPKIDKIINFD